SGRIEECADVIALLSRAEYYASCEDEREEKAGEAMLSVVKNRQGPIGDVPLTFHKEIMKFEDSKEDW
ncbi:MAG: DnaB-like helicase C-terminal domain-containing protein, partial [Verrucomicrobiota bacterium]